MLGPGKLLVVGLSTIGDETKDAERASVGLVRGHLDAGADHVTMLPPLDSDFSAGVDHLERLAPALTELG